MDHSLYFTINNLEQDVCLKMSLFFFFLNFSSLYLFYFEWQRNKVKDKNKDKSWMWFNRGQSNHWATLSPLSFFSLHLLAIEKQGDPAHRHTYTHLPYATLLPLPAFALCPMPCFLPPLHSCLAYSTIQLQPPAIQLATRPSRPWPITRSPHTFSIPTLPVSAWLPALTRLAL